MKIPFIRTRSTHSFIHLLHDRTTANLFSFEVHSCVIMKWNYFVRILKLILAYNVKFSENSSMQVHPVPQVFYESYSLTHSTLPFIEIVQAMFSRMRSNK